MSYIERREEYLMRGLKKWKINGKLAEIPIIELLQGCQSKVVDKIYREDHQNLYKIIDAMGAAKIAEQIILLRELRGIKHPYTITIKELQEG